MKKTRLSLKKTRDCLRYTYVVERLYPFLSTKKLRMVTMRPIRLLLKLIFYTGIFIALTIGTILTISYVLGPPELSNDYVTVLYDHDGEKIENANNYHKQLHLDEISDFLI